MIHRTVCLSIAVLFYLFVMRRHVQQMAQTRDRQTGGMQCISGLLREGC